MKKYQLLFILLFGMHSVRMYASQNNLLQYEQDNKDILDSYIPLKEGFNLLPDEDKTNFLSKYHHNNIDDVMKCMLNDNEDEAFYGDVIQEVEDLLNQRFKDSFLKEFERVIKTPRNSIYTISDPVFSYVMKYHHTKLQGMGRSWIGSKDKRYLDSAVDHKNRCVVKMLLDLGINPNVKSSFRSVMRDEIVLDMQAIKHKTRLFEGCDNAGTALHKAAEKGYVEIIEELIAHGADINIQDFNGLTPLHQAVQGKQIRAVQLLCRARVDLNIKNRLGQTALHQASEKGYIEIIGELRAHGAHLNIQDNEGNTPLHKAVQAQKIQAVQSLCSMRAHVNIQDNLGQTALYKVCLGRRTDRETDFLGILLRAHADVNIPDNEGNVPLHIAVKCDRNALVDLLIKAGANLNAQNDNGDTALHYARYLGSNSGYSLLKAGAKAFVKNKQGMLPEKSSTMSNDNCRMYRFRIYNK